ncbi:MAG: nucleotidyltransferase domain-containing protein [bacterium]
MRLDECERRALKQCLSDFNGEVYLFGSRLDDTKKGGDIDILLFPRISVAHPLKLSLRIQTKFFSLCEQQLDVVVYREDDPFYREIMKDAQRLDIERI